MWCRRAKMRVMFVLPAFVALALSLVACGGSSSTSSETSPSSGESSSSELAAAESKLSELYKGTYANPPAKSPKPEAGKQVWIISTSQAITIVAEAAQGAQNAGKQLGWDIHVFDAKGDPANYLTGVRQAIAAGAEGLVLLYVDCQYVQPGLEEAEREGIEVTAVEASDCNQTNPKDEPLFGYVVNYQEGPFHQWIEQWGAAQATWDIVTNHGEAKVVEFKETDNQATLLSSKGFGEELATCPDCSIVDTVSFTAADLGQGLEQKAQQAFIANPDANSIEVPYDAVLTLGVLSALRASGLSGQIHVMGGEGNPANLDLIRNDEGQDAAVGLPAPWEGYAAMDGLNRLFAGEDPYKVSSGIGIQIVDTEHNLPASGPYEPIGKDGQPISFEDLYAKAWAGE